jgi:hypothetical protein
MNVTLSPLSIPRMSRTSFGIVTCPLDITFALSIKFAAIISAPPFQKVGIVGIFLLYTVYHENAEMSTGKCRNFTNKKQNQFVKEDYPCPNTT